MYMVSLKQAAGIAREEMTSLDAITAELLNFIQLKSQRLYMHSLQVANYSVSVAAKLTLPKSEIEQVKYAALLHDVGLLFVSNTLLAKMPYLNRSEKAQYKRHHAQPAATCWKTSPAARTSCLTSAITTNTGTARAFPNTCAVPISPWGRASSYRRLLRRRSSTRRQNSGRKPKTGRPRTLQRVGPAL